LSATIHCRTATPRREDIRMLERIQHPNGVVTWQSPRLRTIGIPHGFATRIGGVSDGPFAALNLGNPSGCTTVDMDERITENYARLQDAIGLSGIQRAWVKQVHGDAVVVVGATIDGDAPQRDATLAAEIREHWSGQTNGDALLTTHPGVALSIRIADCVPVLLASADGKIVGAAHAGWRGVVQEIVPRLVRAFGEEGVLPSQLIAAIGPGISVEHFEVGPEVAEAFARAGLAAAVQDSPNGKPHIDLQAALQLQLARAGVLAVDGNACCTVRDISDFYSHRRAHGITGRMAALIEARA
jgi:YfiH family protein